MLKVGATVERRVGDKAGKRGTVFALTAKEVLVQYSDNYGTGIWDEVVRKAAFSKHWKVVSAETTSGPTSGHCSGNGGLRGHSVGDVFPVVPYMRGNPNEIGGLTYWLRLPNGQDIGPYYNADDQHRAAAWYKAQC